ncbi:MAG: hypothetical protein HOV66_27930 [Streptomycetaceae bacterium]|nr:hypothetical protein [Streptomycetaceae bacterium]
MTQTRAINAAADVICRAMQQGKSVPANIAFALDSAGMLQSPEVAAEVARLRDERHTTNSALAEVTLALRAAEAERDALRAQVAELGRGQGAAGIAVHRISATAWQCEADARTAIGIRSEVESIHHPVAVPFPPRGARCACGHSGADHHHPGTACWGELSRLRASDGTVGPARVCDCSRFTVVPPETAADGALTAEELAQAPDGTYRCRCGHWDNVHGPFCFAAVCGCGQFAYAEQDVKPQVQTLRHLLSRQRAAVVEDPHDGPLHHPYELGRDLPETGVTS